MKKTTLFRLFTFMLLMGLLASCQKEKPTGPGGGTPPPPPPPPAETYYVKMKVDGAAQTFSSDVKAIRTEEDSTHILQIQGVKAGTSADEMHLLIFSANPAAVGDYVEGLQDTYFILGAYAPDDRADDMGIFYSGVHLEDEVPFKLKITEVTSTYVKGTFSGTFYDNEGEGSNKKIITEGEFKAPLQ